MFDFGSQRGGMCGSDFGGEGTKLPARFDT